MIYLVFIIGSFMDILGAYFLAHGLLLKKEELLDLSNIKVTYDRTVEALEIKTDAFLGLSLLGAGFLSAIIGYVLQVYGVESKINSYLIFWLVILLAFILMVLFACVYLHWARDQLIRWQINRISQSLSNQEQMQLKRDYFLRKYEWDTGRKSTEEEQKLFKKYFG